MATLTGTFTLLDGSPASGTVRVTPSRSPIVDVDGKIVISGSQVFPLDKDGKLTAQIPASDDPDLGPPFTYTIDANLTHASWKISKVWIPHGSTTVDLSEIGDYTPTPGVPTRVVTIPADGEDGQVLVWDGAGFSWDFPPKGDKGDKGDPGTSDIVVDTTVGTRVFANGVMVHGDTGWRNVSGLLINGWTSTNLRLRRTEHEVRLVGTVSATSVTSDHFMPSITGFLPPSGLVLGFAAQATTRLSHAVQYAATTLYIAGGTAASYYVDASWTARDAWPTVLPGTPL